MWNGGYRQQFISIPFRFKSSSGHFFFSYFISRGAHPFAFLAKQNASTMLRKWSFFLPFSSVLFQPIFCCFQFSRFLTRPSNLPLTCRFQFKAWLVVSMTSFRSVWPVRAISIPVTVVLLFAPIKSLTGGKGVIEANSILPTLRKWRNSLSENDLWLRGSLLRDLY